MTRPAPIRALLIEDSLGDALRLMQRLVRGQDSPVEIERATTLQHGLDLLYALLSVQDSGRGLDSHALSRIFDPLYTTKTSGRGLGLAAALSAVRRHSGWIGAGSGAGGRGARFQVLLPIAG